MNEIKFSKEMRLNGTNNDGFCHRYSFDKTPSFKKGFIFFMTSLKFDKEKIEDKFIIRERKDSENDDEEIIRILEPKDLEDLVWYFKNNEDEIDIFWGNKKVIMLIRINKNNRLEKRDRMIENLESKSDWISKEEKEKRLNVNKKKINTFSKIR